MIKKINKIIIVLGICMICLFSSFFCKNVVADDEYTVGRIEAAESKASLKDLLAYGAQRRLDPYFDADPGAFLSNDYSDAYQREQGKPWTNAFYYQSVGCCCIEPGDHPDASDFRIDCCLDVYPNGDICVTKIGAASGEKFTVWHKREDATSADENSMKLAYALAWWATEAINDSQTTTGNGKHGAEDWKWLIRFDGFNGRMQTLWDLGVMSQYGNDPSLPQDLGDSKINAFGSTKCNKIVDDFWDGKIGYRARFVMMEGKQEWKDRYGNVHVDQKGQDDMIFSGKKEEVDNPSIQIIKVDEDEPSKKLSGAKFTISNGGNSITVETNASGMYTYRSSSKLKLKVGEEYTIKEIKAPTGYDIPKEDTQKIKLKKGVNKVTFEDPKPSGGPGDTTIKIKIRKKDSLTDKPLKGAKFVIFRYKENNNKGTFLKSNGGKTYTQINPGDAPDPSKVIINYPSNRSYH